MNGYALLIGLGAAVGLARITLAASPNERIRRLASGLLVLVLILTGARLGYAGVRWQYYGTEPFEISRLWLGGLAWPGAAAGGLTGLALAGLVEQTRLLKAAARCIDLVVPLAAGGWLGQAWIVSSDQGGGDMLVCLGGAAAALLLAGLTGRENFPRWPDGLYLGLVALGLAVCLGGPTLLQTGSGPLWLGVSLETWAAGGLILVGLTMIIIFKKEQKDGHTSQV